MIEGNADATWIFLNWEGVEAQSISDKLTYFHMRDYQIPYSYSPVLAACESRAKEKQEAYKSFIAASKKGFLYCQGEPEGSLEMLRKYVPAHDSKIDLMQALKISSPHFGTEQNWGELDETKIKQFLDWIRHKELEIANISLKEIATSEYLP